MGGCLSFAEEGHAHSQPQTWSRLVGMGTIPVSGFYWGHGCRDDSWGPRLGLSPEGDRGCSVPRAWGLWMPRVHLRRHILPHSSTRTKTCKPPGSQGLPPGDHELRQEVG